MKDSNHSSEKPVSKKIMLKAFTSFDNYLKNSLTLYLGGGGAMILAHGFPMATTDVDAVPKGESLDKYDSIIKKIAREFELPGDWLNPYFSTFVYVLPADFHTRLISVFEGKNLQVLALGAEDMMLLKCFAHRAKDRPHARALLREKINLKIVESRIEELKKKSIPNCDQALEFLDDIIDEVGE